MLILFINILHVLPNTLVKRFSFDPFLDFVSYKKIKCFLHIYSWKFVLNLICFINISFPNNNILIFIFCKYQAEYFLISQVYTGHSWFNFKIKLTHAFLWFDFKNHSFQLIKLSYYSFNLFLVFSIFKIPFKNFVFFMFPKELYTWELLSFKSFDKVGDHMVQIYFVFLKLTRLYSDPDKHLIWQRKYVNMFWLQNFVWERPTYNLMCFY